MFIRVDSRQQSDLVKFLLFLNVGGMLGFISPLKIEIRAKFGIF